MCCVVMGGTQGRGEERGTGERSAGARHFKRETIHLSDGRRGFSEHKGEDVYQHPSHSWTRHTCDQRCGNWEFVGKWG